MTFDPTKPVQTRDGRKARILATDRKDKDYPIVAVVEDKFPEDKFSAEEDVCCFTSSGKYWNNEGNCDDDLVNIPQKIEMYLNIHQLSHYLTGHSTRSIADGVAISCGHKRIACVKVTFEEGQLDE